MVRRGIRPIVIGAFLAILVSGCSLFGSRAPEVPVTIYGHNDGGADAWFGLSPLSDPPQAVGFGADGVACLYGPVGSDIVWFDGPPGQGGQLARGIGRVAVDDASGPNVYWVEVAADGTLTTGRGVPAWWDGVAEHC